MKTYQTFIIALCALFAVNCSSIQPQPQTKSPTEVLKTLNEASKTKDVEAIKNSVSKGTLGLIEEAAKAQNTTADELLKKENGAPFKELPEMRNEKIEGDTATLELKNATTGEWEAVPFVKEDGAWRLALDKYLEDMKRKMTENMKKLEDLKGKANEGAKMPPAEGNSESSAAPGDNADMPKAAANKPAKGKK